MTFTQAQKLIGISDWYLKDMIKIGLLVEGIHFTQKHNNHKPIKTVKSFKLFNEIVEQYKQDHKLGVLGGKGGILSLTDEKEK